MKPTPSYSTYLKVRDFITKHTLLNHDDKVVLAISGGQDSVAMLDIFSRHYENKCTIAHVNHNIRENSRNDAIFVKNLADKLGLECYIIDVDVPQFAKDGKLSIETAARVLRRQALLDLSKELDSKLALAHTMTDNAESILMHILHGSGSDGLKGMQPSTKEQEVEIIRPLLGIDREKTGEYCELEKLDIALDSTNEELKYKRNWIRNQLIPLLETQNKSIVETIARLGENMSTSMENYDELYRDIGAFRTNEGYTLGRHWLSGITNLELKKGVEYCGKDLTGAPLSLTNSHIQAIKHIINKADGSESVFSYKGIVVKRLHNEVFVNRKK